ncbi:tRNA uridine-5-carboxymethylaminomethyl(34) synthesis GTPase MnmE [Enterovirga rhinocerotis]|uniref:tRNA modification GTPase MnmE n=1 Tax=Enterovirga rhinocerotis TaxID=1339210 RepID=A0A4R7BSY6_9HYPH|nr:tRNA uridine-5-carboxymethylaminomethyl(34) synthesis GTPase MnmE [Enterovirga rhinocerotis]TDR87116.1 tRNA modification GTPase [Enterovirga rhinocerotis]
MTLDTIFAIASGIGRSAVAIVRISGPQTDAVLERLLGGRLPEPRRAVLRRLRDPATGEILDQALVLRLPGPASFTGEDQAELQIHGSTAVRTALLRVLAAMAGCRAAEPGEFTRRAFLNGRLDLTEVEGLADLIDAETEAQRRQALRQMEGAIGRDVARWRDRLVDALAACEAALDFADEDDVPDDVASGVAAATAGIHAEIAAALAGAARGERVRDGFQVVIAGPPNAGKSTLLNALARRDVAIVSPIPGTTRDLIEIRCDLGGLPVVFVDTAGLRESEDLVEREGIARARDRVQRADLVLWLVAADAEASSAHPGASRDAAAVETWIPAAAGIRGVEVLTVATKSDLGQAGDGSLAVSAKTGEGVPALIARVEAVAAAAMTHGSDAVLTRERHRAVLSSVADCLDRAALARQHGGIELLAEDLRLALRHLGRMTGEVDVEEVLDRIFASFCIGK